MKIVDANQVSLQGVSHDPEILKQVLIANGEIPNLTYLSLASFSSGQSSTGHSHRDMYEVFFVNFGRGLIVIDGNSHELKPGVCVVVEPGEEHVLKNSGEEEMRLTYFGITFAK